MYDYENVHNGVILSSNCYSHNLQGEMSGRDFMCKQEIPWVPWCYIYKRSFLIDNQIWFVENVRFEDADYVIRCTVKAKRIAFIPLVVICHVTNDNQTTLVGNDISKIIDLFRLSYRVKLLGIEEKKYDLECSNAVMGHHLFCHKYDILRYLWRVPFKKMVYILNNYKAYTPNNSILLTFSAKCPFIFALILQTMKPFFPLLRRMYMFIK